MLAIADGVQLIPQGSKEASEDAIPWCDPNALLDKKSMLIVARDVQAKEYLEAEITAKLINYDTISKPFYKMSTLRMQGLGNQESGMELEEVF
ncbi:hypothetical protein HDE_10866 [Halotydeus destructor]|nr:hypothetical protein HDE_10866 [Halotydeus destructor]